MERFVDRPGRPGTADHQARKREQGQSDHQARDLESRSALSRDRRQGAVRDRAARPARGAAARRAVVHRDEFLHERRGARRSGDQDARHVDEPQAQHHHVENLYLRTACENLVNVRYQGYSGKHLF